MDVMTVLNKFVPKTFAPFSLQKSLDKIEKAFNEDTVEKVLKNLENINSEFAKEQIRVIQTMVIIKLKKKNFLCIAILKPLLLFTKKKPLILF